MTESSVVVPTGRLLDSAYRQLAERGEQLEAARRLLSEWEHYARTMAEAGVNALPVRLCGSTVAFLDATAV